jgi:peptidoglycan/LPS O-acetylase OafA/YrhL
VLNARLTKVGQEGDGPTVDDRTGAGAGIHGGTSQLGAIDSVRYAAEAAMITVHGGPPPVDWRVNNFDLIRLLAALQVAVVHALMHLKPTGSFVHIARSGLELFPGVPIFFVISGLLISKSYEQSDSIRNYYRNRCLRIFPGLWVCLVVSIGVILIGGVGSIGTVLTRDWLLWWAAQMSFFQNYTPAFLEPFGSGMFNGSLWTIPIELEFYLFLPTLYFILRLRRRRGHTLVLTVLLASLVTQLVLVYGRRRFLVLADYDFLFLTLVPYLWMFLVGLLIQRNWSRVRGCFAHKAHWWLLGYLLLCMVTRALHIGDGGNNINPIFLLPLAGLVVSCATSAPGLSDRILRHRDISYGTYIYHALVINLMLQFGVRAGVPSVMAAIGISLAFAAMSWAVVEKPFLMRKRSALRAAET